MEARILRLISTIGSVQCTHQASKISQLFKNFKMLTMFASWQETVGPSWPWNRLSGLSSSTSLVRVLITRCCAAFSVPFMKMRDEEIEITLLYGYGAAWRKSIFVWSRVLQQVQCRK